MSFNVHLINWPRYQDEISFREVAEKIITGNPINENDVIGGSSLQFSEFGRSLKPQKPGRKVKPN